MDDCYSDQTFALMNRRDKVKVLIIEDNNYKLEDAIRILQEFGINHYVHVNSYLEAVDICFRKERLSEFDFIILDIQFYLYRHIPGSHFMPDAHAGYKFLYQLASHGSTKPVFVFSSVKDYLKEYEEFLFPSFSEYNRQFNSQTSIFILASARYAKYEEEKKKNEQILANSNFVIGHAHNRYELKNLVTSYLNSNNQNG